MTEQKEIQVHFFCGKDTPLKRYKSYFKNKLNIDSSDSTIALCHSLGIIDALKSDAKYIIAMDPTIISADERVYNWLPESRECSDKLTNIFRYKMPEGMEDQNHYPYKAANIRDKIVEQMINLIKPSNSNS
jgi:hypothetical protein